MPPTDHARRAEQAVLGGILRLPQALADIDLRPEDFGDLAHQLVYRAMLHVRHIRNALPDMVAVADQLHRENNLADAGGYDALVKLWEGEPTGAQVRYHASLVREHALWRALRCAGATICHEADHPCGSAEEALQRAERAVLEIARMGASGEAVPLAEAVESAVDRIDARSTGEASSVGLATGFLDLDEMTAGLHPDELVVIAARPSTGKTGVGLALLAAVARQNRPVFFASLEQPRIDIAERLLSMESGIHGSQLRKGRINAAEAQDLAAAREALRRLPFHIDDAPGQTALRIASTARRLHARRPLGMVVVDYLQIVEPENRRETRQEQVAGISRRLKLLARELKVPVVALAQINRESEHRQDKKPRLADIRESGAVEQDADVVILLHKPETDGLLELIIAKQRNGPVGEVTLQFDPARMQFADYQLASGPAF